MSLFITAFRSDIFLNIRSKIKLRTSRRLIYWFPSFILYFNIVSWLVVWWFWVLSFFLGINQADGREIFAWASTGVMGTVVTDTGSVNTLGYVKLGPSIGWEDWGLSMKAGAGAPSFFPLPLSFSLHVRSYLEEVSFPEQREGLENLSSNEREDTANMFPCKTSEWL